MLGLSIKVCQLKLVFVGVHCSGSKLNVGAVTLCCSQFNSFHVHENIK